MKCCVFLAICSCVFGEIIEARHFREISEHVAPDTLILLDIDDTILVPIQMLGSDEWFTYQWKTHENEGMNRVEACEKTLREWEAVRHLTAMELVEPETNATIQDLQAQGFCVMGLTTQGLALATRTVQQLEQHHINLSKTAPSPQDYFLSSESHGVLYRHGILFTSGTKKGKALFQLCEKIGYFPKRILFINDKASHLTDVETAANERKIPFLGLRYAYSDARKALFRPEIADWQFTHSSFAHILSDEEAERGLRD